MTTRDAMRGYGCLDARARRFVRFRTGRPTRPTAPGSRIPVRWRPHRAARLPPSLLGDLLRSSHAVVSRPWASRVHRSRPPVGRIPSHDRVWPTRPIFPRDIPRQSPGQHPGRCSQPRQTCCPCVCARMPASVPTCRLDAISLGLFGSSALVPGAACVGCGLRSRTREGGPLWRPGNRCRSAPS